MDETHSRQDSAHSLHRASSEASSSTGSSATSNHADHPPSDENRTKGMQESDENTFVACSTRDRLAIRDDATHPSHILTERMVADSQQAAGLDTGTKVSTGRGKRKQRQGQKSKEAYNRKRREKKKQERRERTAAARQLTSGHATLVAIDAARAL